MTTTAPIDPAAIEAFSTQVGEELAAASSVALALVGDRLGLYRAMAGAPPMTPSEVAARTGCAERYVREWLANQAAGGWVSYDPGSGRFTLPDAHAAVLAGDGGILGSAQVTRAIFDGLDRLTDAFRSGGGIAWGAQHHDLHEGGARFFRAFCEPMLGDWIGALDQVADRLRDGGRIVDLGCGRGSAALALARAFPHAEVVGIDAHDASVGQAASAARAAGLSDRVSFSVADAAGWEPEPADLVCFLDALHDLGDPVAAARRAARALAPTDGTLLVAEPAAPDRLEDGLHWVGRAYYASSTAFCVPCALDQPGGWALGNQAGEARLRDVLARAGFGRVRVVAATPFQLVLEARLGG